MRHTLTITVSADDRLVAWLCVGAVQSELHRGRLSGVIDDVTSDGIPFRAEWAYTGPGDATDSGGR